MADFRLQPFRPALLGSPRARWSYYLAAVLLLLAMVGLGTSPERLGFLGQLHRVDGPALVPVASLVLALACLSAAVYAASEAARGTRGERVAHIVLAVVMLGVFGPPARVGLQDALLHDLYLTASSATPGLARYWGITLLVLLLFGVAGPTVVLLANLVPDQLARPRVRALRTNRVLLLAGMAATVALMLILALLPTDLDESLGSTMPGLDGDELLTPGSALIYPLWLQFQRVDLLPLLIGMWAGMETARAAFQLSGRRDLLPSEERPARPAGGWGPAIVVGVAVVVVAIVVAGLGAGLAGIALMSLVGLAASGLALGLMGFDTRTSSSWGMSEEWRSAGPIGQILFVLCLPVLGVVVWDSLRGLAEPFRLIADHGDYIHFVHKLPLTPFDDTTVQAIFVDRYRSFAVYAAALLVVLVVGIIGRALFLSVEPGSGMAVWWLARFAGLAALLLLVAPLAEDWTAAPLLALLGLPVLLVLARLSGAPVARTVGRYLFAVLLVSLWACAVSFYGILPAFGVLLATVVWRFVVNAGDLNAEPLDGDQVLAAERRYRQIALFVSLSFLGMGMLLLEHGARAETFAAAGISSVTDQIALALVAPIWLLHLFVTGLGEVWPDVPETEEAPA